MSEAVTYVADPAAVVPLVSANVPIEAFTYVADPDTDSFCWVPDPANGWYSTYSAVGLITYRADELDFEIRYV